MKILAIESSCDETAAAVVEDGVRILSNVVVSQIDIFAEYGGVIPEVAARSHLEVILPVVHKALEDAGLTKDDIDVIAVTHTPGLLGSLLIGTLTARMLAILWKKPLYAVHHLKSHIYANWLREASEERTSLSDSPVRGSRTLESNSLASFESSANFISSGASREGGGEVPEFPLLALVVSGGHTQIIYMRGHNQFEIIGTTRDDAVGECFDKVAKVIGLPYPGGPAIDKAALSSAIALSKVPVRGSRTLSPAPLRASLSSSTSSKIASACNDIKQWYNEHPNYKLPHPKVEGLDFSFSGLKTAVLRAVQAELGVPITTPSHTLAGMLTEQQRADFAAAFQQTACEILLEKLKMALEEHPEVRSVVIAGGVSASAKLREMAVEEFASEELKVYFPERRFAGDNAAMVGVAAYYEIQEGVGETDPYTLDIMPRSRIQ